ncbi:MAG: DUF4301 family protein [Thermodesulfobacteriota bacterium]|nr:DUF4301 family protein [Thermodesulfobacteriota bacterium]
MNRDLTSEDIKQIEARGLTVEEITRQLELFEKGTSYQNLDRPCTLGDGIRAINDEEALTLASFYDEHEDKKPVKFVPASGAATRMFKILHAFHNEHEEIHRGWIASKARDGDKECRYLLTFLDNIRSFAFFDDLKEIMSGQSLDAEVLVEQGIFEEILHYLLSEKGLHYGSLPKGLLKFHTYPDGGRTAFEEHLVEAVDYVKDREGLCRLHFTVSPEHCSRFEGLLEKIGSRYEKEHEVKLDVSFSFQENSTDTLAVDMMNRPFRLDDGTLFFRPGGHGALIRNLNHLKSDIIFIKNIDNVVPDRFKKETLFWKKVLGGYLIRIQEQVFSYLKRLSTGPVDTRLLEEAIQFMEKEFHVTSLRDPQPRSKEGMRRLVTDKLNRPIRVCGMVKNVDEPGGGPFLVRGKVDGLSLQIVESAQIDPESDDQQSILRSSTHFNPVDLVCGVRDWRGNFFDLRQYVNHDAVLISKKSKEGRELKALELPGLWNGAMAYWNTIFVEVPLKTFNPVKTVNDLLRKEHQ